MRRLAVLVTSAVALATLSGTSLGSASGQQASLAACRTTLRASLVAAVNRVLAEQGVASVSELTYDKSEDNIASQTAGVVGVRGIDWQNRPTFQQVIAFFGHRPR